MTALVMFDLDGTLVDTAPEIADAVNLLLRDLKLPPMSLDEVRAGIGHGTRELLQHVLQHAGAAESVDEVWLRFEAHYADTCGTTGRAYPGVAATLATLRAQDRALALVTNKEAAFAHRVLVRHGLSSFFDLIVAGDTLPVKKPDGAVIRHVLATLDVEPEDALFVGDSRIDVATARDAGVAVWAVDHGYDREGLRGAHRPDRRLARFETLAELPLRRIAIA